MSKLCQASLHLAVIFPGLLAFSFVFFLRVAWIKRRTTAAAACLTEHIQSLHSCRAQDNHTVYTELYLLLLFYRILATDTKERGLRSPSSSSSSTWVFFNFASILWKCFILNDLWSSKTPLFITNVASFLDTVLWIKSFWMSLIMHLNLKNVCFDMSVSNAAVFLDTILLNKSFWIISHHWLS